MTSPVPLHLWQVELMVIEPVPLQVPQVAICKSPLPGGENSFLSDRFSPWIVSPVVQCTIEHYASFQAGIGYTLKNALINGRQALFIRGNNSRIARIVTIIE